MKTLENNFINNFQKLDLPLYGVRCPKIEADRQYLEEIGIKDYKDNLDLLQKLCNLNFKKFSKKWKDEGRLDEYKKRAVHEVKTLNKLGFVDYILIIWDVFVFCEKMGIATGIGRGSAGGSLVLYLLGVTKIDPVKYGLFFERFVSEARAKQQVIDGITYLDGKMIADIDSDICYYRRKEVVKYLDEKYPNRTSKMLTVSTLSGKALIKDCGKIVGQKEETEMNKVTSLFPTKYGKVSELEEVYETVEEFTEWADENPLVYKVAQKLKGLIRNKGVHASGTLVGHEELTKTTPVELSADKEKVSGFTMDWATKVNIKLDLLGLKSVSVLDEAARLTGVKIEDVDLEDYNAIYAHLQELKSPKGIFQIEADTNYGVCQQVKPKNLDQLSAVVALARPGALAYVEQYAKYANFGEKPEIDPIIEQTLSSTGNICLYQEQVMKMFGNIGFSLTDAEEIRRAIGKKVKEEVDKWKPKIYKKCKENNISQETADLIWKVCEDSSGYQFNFSHSLSYSAMSALTVYYKFNHPKEFFLALLRMAKHESDSLDEIALITQDMQNFGIKLLPPDLNKSGDDFEIDGGDIRYGLSAMKGVSDKVIQKFKDFRGTYSNKIDLFTAAKQAKISIGVLSGLIQAGALESLNTKSRSYLVLEAQTWNLLKDREKLLVKDLICSNQFEDVLSSLKYLNEEAKNEKGKPEITDSRFKTIKRDYENYKNIYLMNKRNEDLANFFYETELLGFSHSQSLSTIFKAKNPNILSIKHFNDNLADGEEGIIVGVVKDKISRTSKNGNPYVKYQISDDSGHIDCFIFSSQKFDKIDRVKKENDGRLPEEKDVVVIKGNKKDGGAIYVNQLGIQSAKIFMKLSEIKDANIEEVG
jgi:DNA-directed DNA polymerase III PolC